MTEHERLSPLIQHLAHTTVLSRNDAARVVDEVMAFFDQALDDYVRSRHSALKHGGMKNEAIFAHLVDEVNGWRFMAPKVTERQIRRMVYG